MGRLAPVIGAAAVSLCTSFANAGFVFAFNDVSGLAAEAEFTLLDPTTLEVRLRNVSTGVPGGFDSAGQLLTGVSWDFGPAGLGGSIAITGGSIATGPTSSSVNFDVTNVGPGANVGGEWGWSNDDGTGLLPNFISANTAMAKAFGGPNLDGPVNIDGPQGGLVASPVLVPLGGLGAIQDEVIATIDLSGPYTDAQLLADLVQHGTRVEFGSDAAFLTGNLVPAPGTLAVLAMGMCARRRRSRA